MTREVRQEIEDSADHKEEDYGKEFISSQDRVCGVRPWGHYINLYDGPDCKVKRITVKPGGRLSYQYHLKRDELWKVISGRGFVTIQDKVGEAMPGSLWSIDAGKKHRIENRGDKDLVFIEIQTGFYFGEDDIVRIEDDYGRTDSQI
tara:strand:+ start:18020 stop:18460 length:441 start_codon:yes stop_codon:yes gene_type:complete